MSQTRIEQPVRTMASSVARAAALVGGAAIAAAPADAAPLIKSGKGHIFVQPGRLQAPSPNKACRLVAAGFRGEAENPVRRRPARTPPPPSTITTRRST